MKSMILYASKMANDGRPRVTPITNLGETVFVRGEVVNLDMASALSRAKPLEGEILLNTIPLDKEASE